MMTPNHDSLREDVGLYVLGALDPDARAAFEAHLADCEVCRLEVNDMLPVVAGLATAVPQIDPPALLRDRVLDSARSSAGERTRSPGTPRSQGQVRGASPWAWLTAAAALVAAIGAGMYALQLQSRVDELTARLADAERTLLSTRSEIVEARRALGEAESGMRVLLAPDLSRVELAGQAVAADARGRVFYSQTRGLVFVASNLPPLAADRVYQLWMVTATAPASAGLLTPDATGAATIMLPPLAVSEAPVAFAVTLEPAGGVPAPTGDKVLVGLVQGP